MDHDKIEAMLKALDGLCGYRDISNPNAVKIDEVAELIRDLRVEIGNQETKIVDLEEKVEELTERLNEFSPAAVIARIAAANSSDPETDDLTVPLAIKLAEVEVRLNAAQATATATAADNAALIAAVPQLVEALKATRDDLELYGLDDFDDTTKEAIERIDGALASIGRGK